MKNKRIKIKVVFAVLAFMFIYCGTPLVSAITPYGIDLNAEGMENLEENVTVNEDLVKELTPIIGKGTAVVDNPSKWEVGYVKSGDRCIGPFSFFRVHESELINENSGYSWTIKKDRYQLNVKITGVVLDDRNDTFGADDFVAVYLESNGNIDAGFNMYPDSSCAQKISGVKGLDPLESGIYIKTKLELYDTETNEPFESDQLYFGITDIDSAQIYKIMNTNNALSKDNMFVLNKEDIQPADSDLRNMYSPTGKFVYADYSKEDGSTFDIQTGKSNIYVKITDHDAQLHGLDVVFGFLHGAGSGVRYYAKQYVVKYVSDDNGKIKGIEEEDVISGDNPSGSASEANLNYRFTHWTVDKEVTLEDGTVIEAGHTITAEQIKQVIVNDNLVFTAHHVSKATKEYTVKYESDKNGEITGIKSEEVPAKENPAGSESKANENYELDYWVADKDVVLKNGDKIAAGKPLTSEQIKDVVVEQDLVFTAIHKAKEEKKEDKKEDEKEDKKEDIVAPDTGMNTGETNAMQITLSVAGIALGAALIALLPKLNHKKISFKK